MKALTSIFILINILSLHAQNDIPRHLYTNMLWAGYYNALSLSEKWNLNSDIQFRTKIWYEKPSQALLRTGLVFKASNKFNLTLGIAHFRFYLNDVKTRGEWRPWQEISYTQAIGKTQIVSM